MNILALTSQLLTGTAIPYPQALEAAAVHPAKIADPNREALLLGNGDLYGIVWNRDGQLCMRITKNDIWDARVDPSKDGELPHVDIKTHEITAPLHGLPSYSLPYPQPRCAVALRLGPVAGDVSGDLDLERAMVKVGAADATLRILNDRNVLLIDSPQAVVLEEIKAATLPPATRGETDGVAWLQMKLPGDMDYKGMEYAVAVANNGKLKAVAVVTSFDVDGDVLQQAVELARKTVATGQAKLVAEHERRWREFWSRSGVQLEDKQVERWWYRMLYYAGCVCRPGAAPVGILPPLSTDTTPWHADYHHNYNTWQAFWPLPAANHPELADPWIDYNHGMIPRYKNLARVTYGIDGLHVPISSFLHEPPPAQCRSKNQRQLSMHPWGLTIGLAGMTLQSLWQKYLCDQDVEYMREKIYPFLRETATFYVAFMEQCQRDPAGKVRLGPSYSPEHDPMGIFNCPFDIGYARYSFNAMIEAAATLKTDEKLAAQCRRYRDLLPDWPTVVHDGELIVADSVGGEYIKLHNITVPAAPVFPCDQVTWFSPEAEKELFRRTIRATRFRDANAHVMFNIARARLSMPEAVTEGKRWFASRELPNGLFVWAGHAHGTYMGEMIGIAGLVNEYLLQSVDNTIRVFPCWPKDKDASFTNLRAQGGFLVTAEQKAGEIVKLEITATVAGKLRVLDPWTQQIAERKLAAGETFRLHNQYTNMNQQTLWDDQSKHTSTLSKPAVAGDDLVAFPANTRVLFQGDSITDGKRGRTMDPNHILGHGYAFIVAALHGGRLPERNLVFLNRGISGNKVADLQARWPEDTLELKPDVLSILVGINDYCSGVSAADYESQYDQLLAQTVAALPRTRLVLGEPFILPVGKYKDQWENHRDELAKRQAIVAKLALKYNAIPVHFQRMFDEACRRAPAAYWMWDGVHPTYSGHQLMAEEWIRAVKTATPK